LRNHLQHIAARPWTFLFASKRSRTSTPPCVQDGELAFDTDRVVLNAYDASAVEAALVLTEEHGDEVEVVTVGPDDVTETIRKALAMGADRAVHLTTDTPDAYDARVYADVLAGYYADSDADAIFCGKQSQDTDAGLTGPMLAALLDRPYAANVVGIEVEDEELVVERQGDAGTEIVELPVPCLVTCSNDMNEPRIPKLKGIMAAKKKPVAEHPATEFGGTSKTATTVVGYEPVPEREPGTRLAGTAEEMAGELVERLDGEANVL
jgi:electron transfer flavoprotein beta subunit